MTEAAKQLTTIIVKLERWQDKFKQRDSNGDSSAAKTKLINLLRKLGG